MERLEKKLNAKKIKEIRESKKEFSKDFRERKTTNNFEYLMRRYLTEKQYQKYISKEITATKAKEIALQKKLKEIEKDTAKEIEKLKEVENASDLKSIRINVEWKRSYTWGYNPTATVETITNENFIVTEGKASGCGYDKESAAVASALNQNKSILKALYQYKEKKLKQGKSDKSKTACSGTDNRNIIAYGSGYGTLPYFEGGVGMNCFVNIFELLGFKCNSSHGKTFDTYYFYKEEK